MADGAKVEFGRMRRNAVNMLVNGGNSGGHKRIKMNKECKTCKYNKECVNIGEFKENDCLQYEMTIEAMNEEIEKINVRH